MITHHNKIDKNSDCHISQYLYGWGSNQFQILSTHATGKNKNYHLVPKKIHLQQQFIIDSICCMEREIIFLSKSGAVYKYQDHICKKIQNVKNIIKISSGAEHVLALDINGKVFSWGNGKSGCLGYQNFQSISVPKSIGFSQRIIDIYCGKNTSFFITASGQVYACGSNRYGELGVKNLKNYFSPIRIQTINDLKIKEIAGGEQHTLFLTSNGQIYACGNGKDFQLGIKITSDINNRLEKIDSKQKFIKIQASNYSAALNQYGYLFVWGTSVFGSFRNPTLFHKKKFSKLIIKKDNGFVITDDGCSEAQQVWGWGKNEYGELGFGDTEVRQTPEPLHDLSKINCKLYVGLNNVFCLSTSKIKGKTSNKQNSSNRMKSSSNKLQSHKKHNTLLDNSNKLSTLFNQLSIATSRPFSKINSQELKIQCDSKLLITQRYLQNQKNKIQKLLQLHQKQQIQTNKLKDKIKTLNQDKKKLIQLVDQKQFLLLDIKKKVRHLEDMIIDKLKIDNQTINKKLQKELEELQKKFKKETEKINDQKKIYQQQNNRLSEEINSLKTQLLKQKERENQILLQKESEISLLQSVINQSQYKIIQLQNNVSTQYCQINICKQQQQVYIKQLKQLKQDQQQKLQQIELLKYELELKSNQVISLNQARCFKETQIENIKQQSNNLQTELQKINRQLDQQIRIDREKTNQIQKLYQKTNYYESLFKDFQFQEIKYLNQIEQLNEDLRNNMIQYNNKSQALLEKITDINLQRSKCITRQESLNKQNRQLTKRNTTLQTKIYQQNQQKSHLQNNLIKSQQELTKILEQYQHLKTSYEDECKLNIRYVKQIQEMKDLIEIYQKYNNNTNSNNMNNMSHMSQSINLLEYSNEEFSEKNNSKFSKKDLQIELLNHKLEKENVEQRQIIQQLNQEILNIKAELEDKSNKLTLLEQENAEFKQQIMNQRQQYQKGGHNRRFSEELKCRFSNGTEIKNREKEEYCNLEDLNDLYQNKIIPKNEEELQNLLFQDSSSLIDSQKKKSTSSTKEKRVLIRISDNKIKNQLQLRSSNQLKATNRSKQNTSE